MNEKRKFLIIILIVCFIYGIFYFQADINFSSFKIGDIFKQNDNSDGQLYSEEKPGNSGGVRIIDEEDVVIEVVNKSLPAVVSVLRKDQYFDARNGPVELKNSIGTGFIINGKEGIILTNRHVVDEIDVNYSVIVGNGGQSYDVVSITRDPLNDFSILKVDPKGDTLPQLSLGDSDTLKIGQTVIAVGNALGEFGNSVTKGVVSGLDRGILAQSGYFGEAEYIDNVIQTDAALNPGNSGGPLINLAGQVIGINVAISSGAQNIGFSIPINTVKSAINQFQETGKIARPFLGVNYRVITKEIAESRAIPVGAYIERIIPDSPAFKAGLQEGDIVTRVNDSRIDEDDNTLAKLIAKYKVGDRIQLTVDRDGTERVFNIVLEDSEGN